jgi:hypothetical protein
MAKSHYSADSASVPPTRLLLKVRSDVTGSSCAPFPDGAAPASAAFPVTPSSIG